MATETAGRRRRLPLLLLVLLLAGAAVVVAVVVQTRRSATTGQPAAPGHTAEIVRTSLRQVETVDGTLGYGDVTPLYGQLAGTVTRLPAAGSVVRRGAQLYAVDGRGVVLMYGAVAAYRDLTPGTKGSDVAQFERNLSALGYDGFTVDDDYTSRTADVVREWQDDIGLPETGVVELGRVVFLPAAVRVDSTTAVVGQPVPRGGIILRHTRTDRIVSIDLDVDLVPLARVGGEVSVAVPGRAAVRATVSTVGTSVRDEDATGTSGTAGQPATAQSRPTVTVTATVRDQRGLGTITGAPVRVDLEAQRRDGVLAVPVTALLGLREGGYGLAVVDGTTSRIVAVRAGVFAGGLVEVSGDGIAAGMTVGTAPQ